MRMSSKGLPELLRAHTLPRLWEENWHAACNLRRRYWGNGVYLRGIVEFSNCCRQNCLYCGLRRDNKALARYRMSSEAIFAAAASVAELGMGTVVLQAGEDPGFSARELADCIARIKNELGLAIALSFGEHSRDHYRLWLGAGADRYLLKVETCNKDNHARLRPGNTLSARLDCLALLADLGYELGTGLISDLPGESWQDMIEALDMLAGLRPDMLSLGPFVPHPDTPLGQEAAGCALTNLHSMAMARILLPTAHIPVTSALGLHGDTLRLVALELGNVLMPSLTPEELRADYAIYPGKNIDLRSPRQRVKDFTELLLGAGFSLPSGPGGAWRHMPQAPGAAP